jgi:CRISPR/Cas system CMR-associated protein Cmr5 small subunit
MKFMKSRSLSKSTNTNDNNVVMGMRRIINKRPTTSIQPHTSTAFKSKEVGIKLEWGEPIWTFFHTLAEKIKPEYYQSKSKELFAIIKLICGNLPCPICTEHASKYMDKINILSLKTKDDMKLMLFQFHNEVNKRKQYQQFPLSELDTKYANMVTMNVMNRFISSYSKKSGNVQMIATEMGKRDALKKTRAWLSDNLHIFEK